MAIPLWWGSPGIFSSQSSPHCASSNPSITAQVFLPRHWSPMQFSLISLCSGKPCISLSLQFWGQWFTLCLPLFYGSKKSCWFVSLFSCVLMVKTKHWLPVSWQVELENRTSKYISITAKIVIQRMPRSKKQIVEKKNPAA